MKTLKSTNPLLSVHAAEAIPGIEDAAYIFSLNGKEVGQIQLCGSSDFARWGYGVTIEIPGRPHHFYTQYEIKTVKAAQEILMAKLAEYGII